MKIENQSHFRTIVFSGVAALFVTVLTLGVYHTYLNKDDKTLKIEHINATPTSSATYTLDQEGNPIPLDFTRVAQNVMDAVVGIKSTYTSGYSGRQQFRNNPSPFDDFFRNDPFRDFFDPRFFENQKAPKRDNSPLRVGQGSGVIISSDGYIVTNNHVVADADDLEVTLHDNRTYKAALIGSDPATDLALLQIKEKGLTTIPFVNSDEVKIGEWVLAVGNPFNLTSTVTAGIVSAKGRNINILKDRFAVESFIQTDAAINPGNSGGALINLQSGLIGINTAIASPTGAYSGYGFAVPANIVTKVVEDLMEYGVVQRGVLGVMIRNVDGNLKKDKSLEVTQGAYVDSLLENSAAREAGIINGDVIVKVNDKEIANSAELQEIIARHRPGDLVKLKVNRKGKEKDFSVTLKNRSGKTGLVNNETKGILNLLGAEMETIDQQLAKKLDIKGGVKVKKLFNGKLQRKTKLREGFIITKVDNKSVTSVEALVKLLEKKKGGVMLEGVYEDIPGNYYYAFGL